MPWIACWWRRSWGCCIEQFAIAGSDLVDNTFNALGGPIFDKESFTDLVVDAAPNSDLADGTIFNTNVLYTKFDSLVHADPIIQTSLSISRDSNRSGSGQVEQLPVRR
jgi:hypothetical protein